MALWPVGRRDVLRRGAFLKSRTGCVNVAVETQGSILQGGAPGKHRVEGIGVSLYRDVSSRCCDRIVAVSDETRLDGEAARLRRGAGGDRARSAVFAAVALAMSWGPKRWQ